jgi:hypothetical protein
MGVLPAVLYETDRREEMNTEDNGTIKFLENAPDYTELFRISRDGIWAHPDVPVDETAQKVIEALDSYIKELVQKAVEAEREVCAEMVEGMDVQHPKYIAAAIRARGER